MSAMRGPGAAAILAVILATAALATAQQCGSQAGGATCGNCLCCSRFEYCGSTSDYCGAGCQSQCSGCGHAPVVAARAWHPSYPGTFLNGSSSTATTGRAWPMGSTHMTPSWPPLARYQPSAPRGARRRGSGRWRPSSARPPMRPPAGGPPPRTAPLHGATASSRSRARHRATANRGRTGRALLASSTMAADPSSSPSKQSIKLYMYVSVGLDFEHVCMDAFLVPSNYNYGPAGRAIGVDLLNNPDLVATDPTVSFKTALWFWMTTQSNKPSCHDVITGRWTPTARDSAAGRVPGYGVITNVINGGLECGIGQDAWVADRIGFYKRYCDILGVGYGDNLDCNNQKSFNVGLSFSATLAAQ